MSDITPATFDIADLFTGKIYPKDSVVTYMDEEAAYDIIQNARAITQALAAEKTDLLAELEKKHEELVKRAASSKVVFHLTGASRADRKALIDAIREEFPAQKDLFGREVFDSQANEVHADRRWALHTERIVRADGSQIVSPTEEQIRIFRDNAPDSEVDKIEKKILALTGDVSDGFETLVQETDFLSQP